MRTLRHARRDLRRLRLSSLLLADGTRSSRPLFKARRWQRVVRSELAQTREALAAAAAATPVPAATGEAGTSPAAAGTFDDGSYNCSLQFADGWMDRYGIDCSSQASQIAAAEAIAQASSGDPWPNCPDPYDGSGGSWTDTAECEGGGW